MQHGGRGNADLRRFRYHAGEEVVVGTLDWPGVADRRLDVHGRRAKADLAAVVPAEGGGELAVSDGDAVEALQEIDMEEGAAELAVGDALEPDVLLALRHLARSEEHTSELQSLMRISYAVFCLKQKKHNK